MRALLATLLLAAAPVAAQDALTGPEFDAIVTGYTVTYNDGFGSFAGVEAYHPRNRVTWVANGGICQKGRWYAEAGEICFVYEGSPRHVCWQFFHDGTTLTATTIPGAAPWTATSITTDPIACTSPFVGS